MLPAPFFFEEDAVARAKFSFVIAITAFMFAVGWTPTGSMTEPRANATATLLPDGRVLVAGGKAGLGPRPVLSSAELYDPSTGIWTATSSMSAARQIATATRLADGRVLVAGGRGSSGRSTTSAEIYDPATGAWTTTGSMTTSRVRHSAALLPDGRVLVGGGLDDNAGSIGQAVLKSAEVFNPSTGTWTEVESMSANRYGFVLVPLNNGTVLAAGGAASAGDFVFNRSSEIFDAANNRWSRSHDMSAGRGFFSGTKLTDGRVLVAGGEIHDGSLVGDVQTDTAEIYDPANGRWTMTGSLGTRRTGHACVTLNDGRVLVAGGSMYDLVGNGINIAFVDRSVPTATEVRNPVTGAWAAAGDLSEGRTSFMLVKLANGAVLAAGGNEVAANTPARSSAELFP